MVAVRRGGDAAGRAMAAMTSAAAIDRGAANPGTFHAAILRPTRLDWEYLGRPVVRARWSGSGKHRANIEPSCWCDHLLG